MRTPCRPLWREGDPRRYVFASQPDGSTPWRPYRWTSAWRRLRERVGIDKSVRLHDLRHFTATRLLDAGVPVKTVSGRLGHARPATTLNIYAHFVPATDRVAADAMGAFPSRIPDPGLLEDVGPGRGREVHLGFAVPVMGERRPTL